MEPAKSWQDRNAIQKLIENAALHNRDERGKPILWTDRAGAGVSVAALKGVLNAILVNYPHMFPSLATIAGRCGHKPRTVQRVIEVLQAQEILVVEQTRNSRGAKQNRYSILTTKLAYLGEDSRMPLFKEKPAIPSATGDKPTRHQRQVVAPSATSPSAMGGALRSIVRTSEYQRKKDVDLNSLDDEIQEFIIHAKRLGKLIPGTVDDQGFVLQKIAMWRATGEISESDFEECCGSLQTNNPAYPFGYFWQSIFDRIESSGRDFWKLMKDTKIP